MSAPSFEFRPESRQVLCDVRLAPGVTLLLVRERKEDAEWEVWAVDIDGHVYRESRDLTGEPLTQDGAFRQSLLLAEARDGVERLRKAEAA